MKNLITITALLVAGTAFANAEGNTLPEPEWKGLTLTAPSNNELKTGNSGFSWSNYSETSLKNSWQLSFSWTSTNNVSTPIDLFGTSTGSSGGAGGIVLQWKNESGGTLYFGTKGGSDGVSLGNITKPTTGSSQTVVLTYLKSSDPSTAPSVLKLKFGDKGEATVTAPTTNTTFFGNGGVGTGNTRLWTNSGNDTYSNISLKYGDAVSPAVPEPSAFGLLAGLGALALVGARRRRR